MTTRSTAVAAKTRRGAAVLVALMLAGLTVDVLADATQVRPEALQPGSRSEVVFRVSARRRIADVDVAAAQLWSTCRTRVWRRSALETNVVPLGAGRYSVMLSPALGRHGEDRLTGCLRDLTVNFVIGRVESVRTIPAGQSP